MRTVYAGSFEVFNLTNSENNIVSQIRCSREAMLNAAESPSSWSGKPGPLT